MNDSIEHRAYYPTPTMQDFHKDDSKVRGVLGPTGSGKSVGMIAELMFRARQQEPSRRGIRHTRWAVVRQTYPELIATTLKTWQAWMPMGKLNMSTPIRWRWQQEKCFADGTGIDMEVIFLAVRDPVAGVAKLRSFDVTGIWVNEAQELLDSVLITWMGNRCGRYPDIITAPLTWSGLVMDANAMPTDHWWYRWAEETKPEGYRFLRQPAALLKVNEGTPNAVRDIKGQWWIINPQCENVTGQPKHAAYWLDQVSNAVTSWIDINLCGQYGSSLEGKPVYPEFDAERHVASQDLVPEPGVPLQLGFDYGLTPSTIIAQITPRGQLRCIDECCAVSMGMRQFLSDALKPLLANRYPGFAVTAIGEPSGNKRAESDESTANDEIKTAMGLDVKAAPTNLFNARRDAVASFMLRRIQSAITGKSTEEAFLVSPRCVTLLKGLREKYVLRRVHLQGREAWKDEPEDNEWTHIQDALQAVAVTYDRPKQDQFRRDRMTNPDGKPLELQFASDYPSV